MIELRPFEDFAALTVCRNLDNHDRLEAEATRGAEISHLAIWADWRSIEGARAASWVAYCSMGDPFALIAIAHTGQAGVAQAAMLARSHRTFRRELVTVCRRIRSDMPRFCHDLGIHRIEARAWAGHPRASAFLSLAGFTHEADMPGFGHDGSQTFRQFAYVPPRQQPAAENPQQKGKAPCA